MLYMVVERFKTPGALEVYRRARDKGRIMPEGLEYVSSYVDLNFTKCFQLMKTDDENLFTRWIAHWDDLMEFEIIPVRTSKDAMDFIDPRL
jgi:hypothetical protein